MPVMLLVIYWAARWVSRRFHLHVHSRPVQLGAGLVGLLLLLGGELGLALELGGQTPVEHIASRDPVSGTCHTGYRSRPGRRSGRTGTAAGPLRAESSVCVPFDDSTSGMVHGPSQPLARDDDAVGTRSLCASHRQTTAVPGRGTDLDAIS
jgi:hypothetical protein